MTADGNDASWANRFHACALAAGFLASAEGRLDDSRYVQRLAYDLYERWAGKPRSAGAGVRVGTDPPTQPRA